jgi:branched-subunit amino acid ABC-type transport system permease component
MSGEFIEQLTDVSQVGLLVGSLMHVTGLVAAVVGGVGMLPRRRAQVRT